MATLLKTDAAILFNCQQKELNEKLTLVSRAIPNRPSQPVLANVLLVVNQDKQQISLTGFDLSIGICVSMGAVVQSSGSITLPAKLLGDIVSRLPEGVLTISVDESDVATITATVGRYQVRGMPADEYPELELPQEAAMTLNKVEMLAGLRHTLYSCSDDETKQVLTGIHFTLEADRLEWASTDGHRLSCFKVVEEEPADREVGSLTIPGKAVKLLEAILCNGAKETFDFKLGKGLAEFREENMVMTTRLLEGQYPNYNQLIPRQFGREAYIDRRQLIGAMERVAVLADQKNSIVKFSLNVPSQTIVLSVEAQDVGSGREEIPATITGDDLDIAFNVKYLLETLKAISTKEIVLQCNTSTSPAVIRPIGGEDYVGLTMPIQIRSV
jgi:DNA polymerase-3 subunit beta